MEISSDKILDKMEQLVTHAKQASSAEKLNEYIMAIQVLCDVLSDGGSKQNNFPSLKKLPTAAQNYQAVQSIMPSMPQSKPVKIEAANGESLLDF